MSNEKPDTYWRLRAPPPTPDDECCRCEGRPEVILRDEFFNNPIFCLCCNNEVPPERIGFDSELAESIARWHSVHNALYQLWLASGEYEAWAAARLRDPKGQVNLLGQEVIARLNQFIPAYYWWFRGGDGEAFLDAEQCPARSGRLEAYPKRHYQVCKRCRLLV